MSRPRLEKLIYVFVIDSIFSLKKKILSIPTISLLILRVQNKINTTIKIKQIHKKTIAINLLLLNQPPLKRLVVLQLILKDALLAHSS